MRLMNLGRLGKARLATGRMRRRGVALVLAVGLVSVGGVATSAPAFAATPMPGCWAATYYTVGASGQAIYAVMMPSAPYNVYGDEFRCNMSRGTSGPWVTVLQHTLNLWYGRGLAEDGIFGSATQAALRAVQASEGISADGVYGPQTRDNIKWPVAGFSWPWQKY